MKASSEWFLLAGGRSLDRDRRHVGVSDGKPRPKPKGRVGQGSEERSSRWTATRTLKSNCLDADPGSIWVSPGK